jgi:hypothetical protein
MGLFNDSYNVANGLMRMKKSNDKKKEQQQQNQQKSKPKDPNDGNLFV